MCGIAGLITRDGSPVDVGLLRRMAAAMAHRGPDEQRTWIDPERPSCGLAHARLAVLDPAGGRQPMTDPDHPRRAVVFNGEIYNHRDLRRELEARGRRFLSDHSDTEVLLPLYGECGDAVPERLRGMFAFGLYDGPGARLVLARDRLGQKPLYWTVTDRCFAFATELPALAAVPGVSRDLDREALGLYLVLGYVPAPLTIYRGVRKLPPASRLVVPLDASGGGALTPSRYWTLPVPLQDAANAPVTDDAALAAALRDAVAVRLEADVPLGFFLSGGLDSSLVAALARQACPDRPLRTFSMSFPDARYDESRFAERVARHIRAEHTRLELAPASLRELLPTIARTFGEPFADASAIPTYLLCREARHHVTVALSGDGGDELFGGYDRYRAVALAQRLDRADPLKSLLALIGKAVPRGSDLKSRRSRLRRFADALADDPVTRYLRWVSPFHEADPAAIARREAGRGDDPMRDAAGHLRQCLPGGASMPFAERVRALDVATYLPGDVLTKVDRASMAHGLEVRSPLLDHRLAELVLSLPLGRHVGLRRQKTLLRRLAAGLLPPEILARPKMGFGVPIAAWLAGPEAGWMREQLAGGPLAASGLVDGATLRRYIDEHTSRRADHGPRLYSLLVLDQFLRDGP
ncbi:MAG TPA: asparagine synthase (glutamine-hydrolyzing) [Phycisphaerae bacterium]|nr:asparagine synthase (glutamine-hydrolyzing) [Phycisphaerae bacterium]HOI54764.1 asparagine synthase (glutamine-hydrolyzing) [Phycisphaerae bacterium]